MKALSFITAVFISLFCLNNAFAQDYGMMEEQEIPDIELIIGIQVYGFQDQSQNLQSTLDNENTNSQTIAGVESEIDETVAKEEEEFEPDIETEPIMIRSINPDVIYNDRNIRMYPNPASNATKFETNSEDYHTLEIYNLIGNLVYSEKILNNFGVNYLNLSDLSSGIYMVHFVGEQKISTKKLALKR